MPCLRVVLSLGQEVPGHLAAPLDAGAQSSLPAWARDTSTLTEATLPTGPENSVTAGKAPGPPELPIPHGQQAHPCFQNAQQQAEGRYFCPQREELGPEAPSSGPGVVARIMEERGERRGLPPGRAAPPPEPALCVAVLPHCPSPACPGGARVPTLKDLGFSPCATRGQLQQGISQAVDPHCGTSASHTARPLSPLSLAGERQKRCLPHARAARLSSCLLRGGLPTSPRRSRSSGMFCLFQAVGILRRTVPCHTSASNC